MTITDAAAAPPAALPILPPDDTALQPVERSYVHVLRIGWAILLLPLLIGAVALDMLVLMPKSGWGGWLTGLLGTLVLLTLLQTPARQYARIGYAMGVDQLRVVQGFLFHTDTLVPFVRVQHIDVAQGPVERLFGLSRLVVHTAGTHNSIITLPGLARADAEAIRETVRQHIVSDFA